MKYFHPKNVFHMAIMIVLSSFKNAVTREGNCPYFECESNRKGSV
jgi:hypothetical protein